MHSSHCWDVFRFSSFPPAPGLACIYSLPMCTSSNPSLLSQNLTPLQDPSASLHRTTLAKTTSNSDPSSDRELPPHRYGLLGTVLLGFAPFLPGLVTRSVWASFYLYCNATSEGISGLPSWLFSLCLIEQYSSCGVHIPANFSLLGPWYPTEIASLASKHDNHNSSGLETHSRNGWGPSRAPVCSKGRGQVGKKIQHTLCSPS
jgi:hypothetical protein